MSRVQLALNVTDLDKAVDFYSKLFGTEPAKRKPGYANFAIADPPLKLVLFEGAEGGTINHLGVETETAAEVEAAEARLSGTGLDTTGVDDTVCCYATKVETWVSDPDGARWEWYVKTGDADQLTYERTDEVMSARTEPSGAELREQVRERYAAAARSVDAGEMACCGPGPVEVSFGSHLYDDAERGELPDAAVAASLGCGNPLMVADLAAGETVLDLGSGGGIDVILSARRVAPGGRAYGLDMTDEMLDLARRNAATAGVDNVEFVKGHIEDIPLPDESIDVIISNCVINLSVDKAAVFAEMQRVLRPGGRVGVSDVVAEDRLSHADRAARGDHVGCIAGALSVSEYEIGLRDAGFADVSITFTHEVADGLHGAIVRAVKPAT